MSKGDIRCIDGRSMRHDPQHNDPYLETDLGACPDCDGAGCDHTCPRCGESMEPECVPDGCRDRDCPMLGAGS